MADPIARLQVVQIPIVVAMVRAKIQPQHQEWRATWHSVSVIMVGPATIARRMLPRAVHPALILAELAPLEFASARPSTQVQHALTLHVALIKNVPTTARATSQQDSRSSSARAPKDGRDAPATRHPFPARIRLAEETDSAIKCVVFAYVTKVLLAMTASRRHAQTSAVRTKTRVLVLMMRAVCVMMAGLVTAVLSKSVQKIVGDTAHARSTLIQIWREFANVTLVLPGLTACPTHVRTDATATVSAKI